MLSVVSSVFGSVASLVGINAPRDDDFIDRLNHVITVSILSLFAIFVSSKQLAGDPINCWLSDNYKDSHKDYIKHYCWIGNTYQVNFDGPGIPQDEKERQMTSIKYYQWVPVILMFQILMFKLPHIVWISLKTAAGINMKKLSSLAESTQLGDMETRETEIKNMATTISRWLEYKREHHFNVFSRMRSKISRFSVILFFLGLRNGTYLVGLYMFVKLLFFINVVVQFFMLDLFLGENFRTYGFDLLRQLSETQNIEETNWFPRVTFCDFYVRQMTNLHTHTTQCVLSVNLFTEKIFIFIWFWLFMLGVVNCYSFLRWFYKVTFRKNRIEYVERYLATAADDLPKDDMDRFVNVYLRDDGVFLLRVVATNSSPLVMLDLVKELWTLYKSSHFSKIRGENEREEQKFPRIHMNPLNGFYNEDVVKPSNEKSL